MALEVELNHTMNDIAKSMQTHLLSPPINNESICNTHAYDALSMEGSSNAKEVSNMLVTIAIKETSFWIFT